MEEFLNENNQNRGTQVVRRSLIGRLTLSTSAGIKNNDLGDQPCSIGRGEECSLRINDFKVSRVHALIKPTTTGEYWLEDQGSRNGTYLNGEKMDHPVVLESGSLIRVGDSEIRFTLVDLSTESTGELSLPSTSETIPPLSTPANFFDKNSPLFTLRQKCFSFLSSKRARLWGGGALAIFTILAISQWPSDQKGAVPVAKTEEKTSAATEERAKVDRALLSALSSYRDHRYGEAMKGAGLILQVDSNNEKAKDLLIAAEQAQIAQQEQADMFQREREAKELSDQVAFYYSLGLEHLTKGSLEAAIENFEKVLEIDPNHEEAHLKLAAANEKKGTPAATHDDSDAGKEKPIVATPLPNRKDLEWAKNKNWQAKKLYDQKQYGQAIQLLKEVTHSKKKLSAELEKSLKGGLQKIRDALSQKYGAELTQAEVLIDSGEYLKAQGMLEGILKEDPAHPQAAPLHAIVRKGLDEEAKRMYVEAIVDENVGDLEAAKGKFRKIASSTSKENAYYQKAVEKLRKLK